jgi:hypothetical protein
MTHIYLQGRAICRSANRIRNIPDLYNKNASLSPPFTRRGVFPQAGIENSGNIRYNGFNKDKRRSYHMKLGIGDETTDSIFQCISTKADIA